MQTIKDSLKKYLEERPELLELIKTKGQIPINYTVPYNYFIQLPEGVRQLIFDLDGNFLSSRQRKLCKDNEGMEVIFINDHAAYKTKL